MCFQSLLIMLKHFVFDEHTVLWLETNFSGRVGGWVGGWLDQMKI